MFLFSNFSSSSKWGVKGEHKGNEGAWEKERLEGITNLSQKWKMIKHWWPIPPALDISKIDPINYNTAVIPKILSKWYYHSRPKFFISLPVLVNIWCSPWKQSTSRIPSKYLKLCTDPLLILLSYHNNNISFHLSTISSISK